MIYRCVENRIFNNFSYGLALLRALAVWALMPFLCRSTKKWRKKGNGGFAPRPRAASGATVRAFRWKPAVSKAALKGFIQARLLHLEVSDLKMGGVGCKFLFGR